MRARLAIGLAGLLLVLGAAHAFADDTEALIALDKQWGEAGSKGDSASVAKLLADDLVSVTESGVRGKKEELADNEPAPAGTKYEPVDFKVTFLDSNTAIMTHSTTGADAHVSLHVWSKKSGAWKVVATSTTPVASD
jgi:hypothetical protein